MISSILVLASAVSTDPAPASANVPTFTTFCQTQRSSADEEIVQTCRELAALLAKVEANAADAERERAAVALECRTFLRTAATGNQSLAGKKFQEAIAKAGGETSSEANSGLQAEPCAAVSGLSDEDQAAYKKLTEKHGKAQRKAKAAQAEYKSAYAELVDWQSKRFGDPARFREPESWALQVSEEDVGKWSRIDASKQAIANAPECNLEKPAKENDLLLFPNYCTSAAIAATDPGVRWAGGDKPVIPSHTSLVPSLKIGKSESNAELVYSRQSNFVAGNFQEGDRRRSSNNSYSLAVSAKAGEGLATLANTRPDKKESSKLNSFDRLSGTFQIKASMGSNFFPTESRQAFEYRKDLLVADLTKACEASVKEKKTKAGDTCSGSDLLAWVYERDGKKYARPDRIDAYEKLIWQSSAPYPEFGYGVGGSAGLTNKKYFDFGTKETFRPELVDVDNFFTGTSNRAGTIRNKPNYLFNGYVYRHFPTDGLAWLDGVTARFDSGIKYDLEDLDKTDKTICVADLGVVEDNGVYLESDRCKTVLPFKPEFSRTGVLKGQLRFGIAEGRYTRALGISPTFEYEDGENAGSKWRVSVPVLFSLDDKSKISGGFGLAFEKDNSQDQDKRNDASVFLIIGQEFSLNGGKE